MSVDPRAIAEETGVAEEDVLAVLDALAEDDAAIEAEEDESAFARELSRRAIANQYGDDYFAENPGWAADLDDLGENA